MAIPAQLVKGFVDDSYQLVSAGSPNVTLQGNDFNKALQFFNELIAYYSGTGLLTTIAQEVNLPLSIGQRFVTFADVDYTPAADVTIGRLSNLQNAWLDLDGVTYPLIDESRNSFYASYKFDPLQGLPRFVVIRNDLNVTTMRLYPAPSQYFQLFVFAKFELPIVTATMDMSGFPTYQLKFLKLALAKELSFYKGRSEAWTAKLEQHLKDAKEEMESISPLNLNIESDRESLLNGAWRVRSGI
jgi:hypothetical protein